MFLDSSHFTRRSSLCHYATPYLTSVVSTASGIGVAAVKCHGVAGLTSEHQHSVDLSFNTSLFGLREKVFRQSCGTNGRVAHGCNRAQSWHGQNISCPLRLARISVQFAIREGMIGRAWQGGSPPWGIPRSSRRWRV